MVESTGLVVRHTSYGDAWYRIKYSIPRHSVPGGERFFQDYVAFIQANDVEEATRVLREVLEQENIESSPMKKRGKLEITIIAAVRSDAEIFISKNIEAS